MSKNVNQKHPYVFHISIPGIPIFVLTSGITCSMIWSAADVLRKNMLAWTNQQRALSTVGTCVNLRIW